MERLTIRLNNQHGNPTDSIILKPYMRYQDEQTKKIILNRLAEYEDAEEQGLLLRLPCKVGDTAYYLHREYFANKDKWVHEIDKVEVDLFVLNSKLLVNVSYYIGSEVFRKTLTPYKNTVLYTRRSRTGITGFERR